MKQNLLYVAYGNRAREMTIDLMTRAQVADEIPANARIGLKPNLVVADRADRNQWHRTSRRDP